MQTFKIELSTDQMQVLNAALIKLPYEHAAPLINHINSEIQKSIPCPASFDDESMFAQGQSI